MKTTNRFLAKRLKEESEATTPKEKTSNESPVEEKISVKEEVDEAMANDPLSLAIFRGFESLSEKFDEQTKRMDKQDKHLGVIEHKLDALEKLFREVTQDYFNKVIEDVGSIVRTFEKMDYTDVDDIAVAKRNLEVLDHSAKMLSKDSIAQARATDSGINYSEMYTSMIEPILKNIGSITEKLEEIEAKVDDNIRISGSNMQNIQKTIHYTKEVPNIIQKNAGAVKSDNRYISKQVEGIKTEILEAITGMKQSAKNNAGALKDQMSKETDRARIMRFGSMSTR